MDKINLKEQEKQARREAIMNAALTLFAAKDFHEVTVDEIAEMVGLSKGTLYLYFENKESLFLSIIQEKTEQLFERLETAMKIPDDFIGRLKNVIHTYLTFFDEHRPFYRIIHTEKSRISEQDQDILKNSMMQSYVRYEKMLERFFDEGMKTGLLRSVPTYVMAKALQGLINSFAFQNIFTQSTGNLAVETESILDIFLNGIIKLKGK